MLVWTWQEHLRSVFCSILFCCLIHIWCQCQTCVLSSVLQSKEDQTQVVSNLKTISMSSSKLLLAAKALSTDPNSPNLKNQLAAAARWASLHLSLFFCLNIFLSFFYHFPVFYMFVVTSQCGDRQHQPAHHHVHSAGPGSEGVWQRSQRAGGKWCSSYRILGHSHCFIKRIHLRNANIYLAPRMKW